MNSRVVPYDDYYRETWDLKCEVERERRRAAEAEARYNTLKGVHKTLQALNRDWIDENAKLKLDIADRDARIRELESDVADVSQALRETCFAVNRSNGIL